MSEGRCSVSTLDKLLSWPFNAGETVALALLVAGIVCAHLFVTPDHSHRSDDRSSED